MPNQCRFCGQEINEKRQFCSPACRNRYVSRKMKETRTYLRCLYCGKEFYRRPSEVAKGSVKYCSRACANAYVKEHGRPDKKVANRVCKNCGKEFTIPNCWLKKFANAGQYCSMVCWHEVQRKRGGAFGGSKRATWGNGNGVYIDSHGYIHEYDPQRRKFVRQHRLVMERKLGRHLEKGESVHHKNGKRDDNTPDNLELIVGSHFSGKRVKDLQDKTVEHLSTEIERLGMELSNLKRQLQKLQDK